MYNFHPAISAFPLALFSCSLLTELIALRFPQAQFRNFTFYLNCLASFFTILAFFLGYQALELAQVSTAQAELVSVHHGFGRAILFLLLPLLLSQYLRREGWFANLLYWALLVGTNLLVVYTGYLGADLVFSHGVGVTN